MILTFSIISLLIWIVILVLPWRPWGTKEHFDHLGPESDIKEGMLTVLIPARNEEKMLRHSLPSILGQSPNVKVVVVDDCSTDNTYKTAQELIKDRGIVISGSLPPEGWSGKLWALEQGLDHIGTKYVLLMDADIVLEMGIVSSALSYVEKNGIDFFSLMANLHMESLVERLFMPAFIYFFKLLYPFGLSNQQKSWVAAAAGGFILTKPSTLKEIAGFSSIKDAIIDDCSLAKRFKQYGKRTFIGLTTKIRSIRRYPSILKVWKMVERSAYHQLKYNIFLLVLTTVLMTEAFIIPICGILSFDFLTFVISSFALFIMSISYLSILRYYALEKWLCFTLAPVAAMYMAMTWSSAIRYHFGKGAKWKDRIYKF